MYLFPSDRRVEMELARTVPWASVMGLTSLRRVDSLVPRQRALRGSLCWDRRGRVRMSRLLRSRCRLPRPLIPGRYVGDRLVGILAGLDFHFMLFTAFVWWFRTSDVAFLGVLYVETQHSIGVHFNYLFLCSSLSLRKPKIFGLARTLSVVALTVCSHGAYRR